jgi:hypothetical protein
MAKVEPRKTPVLEQGDIYFLYRPAVDHGRVRDFRDVSRLFILLKPRQRMRYRLIMVGRKRLPDPAEHDRFWAFIWRVFNDRNALNAELAEEEYRTKTRGVRTLPAVRPAAEGIYALVRHGGHTHLAYVLELPKRRGPAERELNIKRQASYIIAVKNPASAKPRSAGLDADHAARLPNRLRQKFGARRWIPVDPPDFLDYEGAELALIGARENAESELGIDFKPDAEDDHTSDVLRDLKLPREIAREPLFEGRWK